MKWKCSVWMYKNVITSLIKTVQTQRTIRIYVFRLLYLTFLAFLNPKSSEMKSYVAKIYWHSTLRHSEAAFLLVVFFLSRSRSPLP